MNWRRFAVLIAVVVSLELAIIVLDEPPAPAAGSHAPPTIPLPTIGAVPTVPTSGLGWTGVPNHRP